MRRSQKQRDANISELTDDLLCQRCSDPHVVSGDGIPEKIWHALLSLGLNKYQAYRAWQIIEGAKL